VSEERTVNLILSGHFHLTSDQRELIQAQKGLDTDGFLRHMVHTVQPKALAPVSDFHVGAAGVNADGEVFLGVNIEFAGASFAQTIHAEQFLISLSRTYSTSPIVKLAVSAPPCGHCRQFLNEFDSDGELEMLIGDEPGSKMSVLLPRAFGPADMKVTEPFYSEPPKPLVDDDLDEAARRAALHSYVPYSGTKAGIAVKTRQGQIFHGAALENAAYNPALPPLQAAIASAYAYGHAPDEIAEVVLCQEEGGQINYEPQLRDLALSLSEEVTFRTIFL
jgi:cytidine deaminase